MAWRQGKARFGIQKTKRTSNTCIGTWPNRDSFLDLNPIAIAVAVAAGNLVSFCLVWFGFLLLFRLVFFVFVGPRSLSSFGSNSLVWGKINHFIIINSKQILIVFQLIS